MYTETISAVNANIHTLAGGGLRAIVEAICLDKGMKGGNLVQRIEQLAEQNLLTKPEADLLHEERYLGNAALHEMATPTPEDIEDGLRIIEHLIQTLYTIPEDAKRLRARREGKKGGPKE